MYTIQKIDSDDSCTRYVKVVNNSPTIVTDINKASIFQKHEAEKYIKNQIKKSLRNTFKIVETQKDFNPKQVSPKKSLKIDVMSELLNIKDTISHKYATKYKEYSDKLQYYDNVILDIRHYIRDDNTKLNACQASKVLYKLQQVERSRADVKRELQRIELINDTIRNAVSTANEFKYDDYKPRAIQNMEEFLSNKYISKEGKL